MIAPFIIMTYQEQIKHPLWQKKRLEVLQRDNFQCQHCRSTEKTLHVHHKYYKKNTMAWDYPDRCFLTLCEECHSEEERLLVHMDNTLINYLRTFGLDTFDMALVYYSYKSISRFPISETIAFSTLINNIAELSQSDRLAITQIVEGLKTKGNG